jgi:hypothetical protein
LSFKAERREQRSYRREAKEIAQAAVEARWQKQQACSSRATHAAGKTRNAEIPSYVWTTGANFIDARDYGGTQAHLESRNMLTVLPVFLEQTTLTIYF